MKREEKNPAKQVTDPPREIPESPDPRKPQNPSCSRSTQDQKSENSNHGKSWLQSAEKKKSQPQPPMSASNDREVSQLTPRHYSDETLCPHFAEDRKEGPKSRNRPQKNSKSLHMSWQKGTQRYTSSEHPTSQVVHSHTSQNLSVDTQYDGGGEERSISSASEVSQTSEESEESDNETMDTTDTINTVNGTMQCLAERVNKLAGFTNSAKVRLMPKSQATFSSTECKHYCCRLNHEFNLKGKTAQWKLQRVDLKSKSQKSYWKFIPSLEKSEQIPSKKFGTGTADDEEIDLFIRASQEVFSESYLQTKDRRTWAKPKLWDPEKEPDLEHEGET